MINLSYISRLLKPLGALSLVACLVVPAQAVLVTGLTNYWSLDGHLNDTSQDYAGQAGTIADNGMFDGANGTGGIGYTGAGKFGDAISQDGATGSKENNGFVRVPRSVDTLFGGESLTTSLWVQTVTFDTSWQAMLAHGEGGQYRFARNSGDLISAYAGGTGDIKGGPNLNDGEWHHVLGVTNHSVNTQLWVDGILVKTSTGAPTINDAGKNSPQNPDLFIGANPQSTGGNREWNGQIDDVAQWNRPLSAAEIQTIYSQGQLGRSLGNVVPVGGSTLPMLLGGLAGLLALRSKRRA